MATMQTIACTLFQSTPVSDVVVVVVSLQQHDECPLNPSRPIIFDEAMRPKKARIFLGKVPLRAISWLGAC